MLSASKIGTPNLSERKINPALGLLNLAKLFYNCEIFYYSRQGRKITTNTEIGRASCRERV